MSSRTEPDKNTARRATVYAIFVLFCAALLWRVENVQEQALEDARAEDKAIIAGLLAEIDREALARDATICRNANEGREAIVNFIEGLAKGARNPAAAQRIVEEARRDFPQAECPPVPAEDIAPGAAKGAG